MLYYSNWFCHMTFLSAVWLLYSCTFICVWVFFKLEIRPWISCCYSFSGSFMNPEDNLLLWIESVFLVFFVDIYLRCWTSMQLILNLKWNYDAQTQSMFSVSFAIVTFFYVWIKFAIMWHLCTWKQCLLYVLNFCVLFCIVSCFVFAKYQYNCWTWKSVFWQLFFKAWNYVYVAALEKPFIKNDWMRISKVSIDTGILTWDFQSDNCIWIMAVFKISTLILLEKCQKVQEHFLVCPRTGVNIFFCRVTN